MTKRVCPTPGCPNLTTPPKRRCPTCQHAHDKARGTRQQRGYNHAHDQLRQYWNKRIQAGHTPTCPKCGQPITPGQPWDLGHTDDRTSWTGPEHQRCNRAHGGHKAHNP